MQESRPSTVAKQESFQDTGRLILAFSTGQNLTVPLHVKLLAPFISLSTPKHHFGTCHVTRGCQGVILVCNPTAAPARWTVVHVPTDPTPNPLRSSATIRVKGFPPPPSLDDDPSVFSIGPNAGVVQGPTMSVAATMACNRGNQSSASDFE